jgi:hypothetical protein
MKTLDLKKDLKELYSVSSLKVSAIQIPKMQFAMIDGAIEKSQSPGTSPGFQEATEALYGISYTIKYTLKKRKTNAVDYPVMPLEGLWWVQYGVFDIKVKDNWFYTLMILQPDVVTQDIFKDGLAELRRKHGMMPALSKLRLKFLAEGQCMQILHVGPYASEPVTVRRMEAFAQENGYRDQVGFGGSHHEIYLGDPRRANPEKLKTILRHPIKKI